MKATTYVQVVPKYAPNGKVVALRCVHLSQKAPTRVAAGAVLLRLNVDVPASVFEPLNIAINVPAEAVARAATITADVQPRPAGVAL